MRRVEDSSPSSPNRSLRSRLKRNPTFNVLRRDVHNLNQVDSAFRYSLSRLPEGVEGAETSSAAGPEEWERLHAAMGRLIHRQPLVPGQLTDLHEDVRRLLRSKAGPFIREYLETRLLASGGAYMLADIRKDPEDLEFSLIDTWSYYYSHVLPTIEAIFVQVQGQRLSVRQTALVAFRDQVVLPLTAELEALLADTSESVAPEIRQMMLVLQSVTECYPPNEKHLQLETLVARAVHPYLGFRGLYENRHPTPVLPSSELAVAQQRRPSVVNDPRRLLRPLSVASGHPADTLSELFSLSADRFRHRLRHRLLS